MKTLREFDYLTPQTLAEAASLLAKHKGEAKILAGGTDLLVMMKERALTPKYVIHIEQISALNRLKWDEKEGLRDSGLHPV